MTGLQDLDMKGGKKKRKKERKTKQTNKQINKLKVMATIVYNVGLGFCHTLYLPLFYTV